MGGRGATSNLAKLAKYGTAYKQVKTNKFGRKLHTKDKRILFIEPRYEGQQSKTPYELMMPNKIYAVIRLKSRELGSITFTDKMGFEYKFIDVKQIHRKTLGKGDLGHVHIGYNRSKARRLRRSERKLLRRILIANGESLIVK